MNEFKQIGLIGLLTVNAASENTVSYDRVVCIDQDFRTSVSLAVCVP